MPKPFHRRPAYCMPITLTILLLIIIAAVVGLLFGAGVIKTGGAGAGASNSTSPSPPGSSPPSPSTAPLTASGIAPADLLGGWCDSSAPPVVPAGAPTMPSVWWTQMPKNGTKVGEEREREKERERAATGREEGGPPTGGWSRGWKEDMGVHVSGGERVRRAGCLLGGNTARHTLISSLARCDCAWSRFSPGLCAS